MAIDEVVQQVLDTARGMWRRRWIGLAVAWVVAVLAAVALTLMPNRYEASARVYVDTKTVLRPLMRDLTVEPDLDQTVGLLARTLITRPNVELLMRRSGLESGLNTQLERDRMVETLMRDIKVTASGRDNVFNFTYRDTQPERGRIVVQNLVSLFLESDTGAKRRDAESAREFIDEQIKNYETRLAEAENRLKEFKLRNLGMTDTSGKDYFARMSALTDELNKSTVELHAIEQSRDALRRELSGENVSLVPDVLPPSSTQVSEYDTRIETQRRQLDDLLRRYTELHPDVIAAQRLIGRLEEQRQQELEARRKAEVGKPRSNGVSSAGEQRAKLALAEAEANVAALRVRVNDTQARLNKLRADANRMPQVEAELAQLNRDYEVVRRTYETMVTRREKASLSEDVDATRSAQFRVIDPPRTAPQPVFPNRLALAPVVLLLALLAGAGACFIVTQLMPTFDSSRALRHVTQRPVLGTVSMMMDGGTLRRGRRLNVAFGSALGALVVAGGIWIAWVSMQVRV